MTSVSETVVGDVAVMVDGHVAVVEVRRGPDNFFDVEMIATLADVYGQLANESTCRVIVLASQGKNFCAGAQFSSSGRSFEDGDNAIPDLYREAARMMRQPLPVVAAVQGAAVGGGLGLACACDFRVASPASRFSANFSRLGFHQGFAISVSLPRIIGQQNALNLLYTGRRIDGTEALRMGLVDSLVDQSSIRDEAVKVASHIAESAPLAVRSIRETMRRDLLDSLNGALEREAAEQARLRETTDWREGVAAMAERRTPRFEGR